MKNIYLYFVLILFALGLNFISKEFIGSEQLIEDYLVENCSYQYIEFFLETQQKLNWLGYLITLSFINQSFINFCNYKSRMLIL